MTHDESNAGITLKDVIVHMQHMEQRLSREINGEIKTVRLEMHAMEGRLIQRMDAMRTELLGYIDGLGEDLRATMKDVFILQKHVGLRSGDELY